MTHNKAAIRAAIEYLQPIADNAQLPGYAKALNVALDTMREATADRHGRGSNIQRRNKMKKYEFTGETIMDDLKPCPFCGEPADLFFGNEPDFYPISPVDFNYTHVTVRCRSCFCGTGFYKDRHRAIEAWNRRVGEEEQDGV